MEIVKIPNPAEDIYGRSNILILNCLYTIYIYKMLENAFKSRKRMSERLESGNRQYTFYILFTNV